MKSPFTPSVATIPFIAWNTGVPAGTTPVANRVLTTSKGVVRRDERKLARPPDTAYFEIYEIYERNVRKRIIETDVM